MLDRRFIRENPDVVKEAVRAKGADVDVDEVLDLDRAVRTLTFGVDEAQARRKQFAKQFARADEARRAQLRADQEANDTELRKLREELAAAGSRLDDLLLRLPGIPWEGAPVGPDESANTVVRTVGTPPEFDFTPLDHTALAEKRGWAEFRRARNVSGERAYALTGDLVLLERAIHSYALDVLVGKGFTPVAVPALVKAPALVGTGMFPKGRDEIYEIPADDIFLAGTAEVALVGLHSGEILDGKALPIRYAGISPCFRREVGSASRDVRGLLRVHQFEKVEQFVVCANDPAESARWHAELLATAEGLLRVHQFEKVEQFVVCANDPAESARWHAELLATAEQLLSDFGLCYEVVECSTGDMGLGKFRMNDVNTWFPALGRFRETHSCSTLHDWQARRANIRYRDAGGKIHFAHTLNNTAVATPRLLAAMLENFQTADGLLRVPEPLRPHLGGRDLL